MGIKGFCLVWGDTQKAAEESTYLSDSTEQLPIGIDNDGKRDHEAKDEKTDDVGGVVGIPGMPVHRAGDPCSFWPIAAPAKQWGHSPEQGVCPGQDDGCPGFPVVGGVRLCCPGHGAAALVREHGQGDEGDDACVRPEPCISKKSMREGFALPPKTKFQALDETECTGFGNKAGKDWD